MTVRRTFLFLQFCRSFPFSAGKPGERRGDAGDEQQQQTGKTGTWGNMSKLDTEVKAMRDEIQGSESK